MGGVSSGGLLSSIDLLTDAPTPESTEVEWSPRNRYQKITLKIYNKKSAQSQIILHMVKATYISGSAESHCDIYTMHLLVNLPFVFKDPDAYEVLADFFNFFLGMSCAESEVSHDKEEASSGVL